MMRLVSIGPGSSAGSAGPRRSTSRGGTARRRHSLPRPPTRRCWRASWRRRTRARPAYARLSVAASEQPLHADADPEERRAPLHGLRNRVAPRPFEHRRGGEIADARHDEALGGQTLGWLSRRLVLGTERVERLAHRRQVAGTVVVERDHSSPFGLGSIFVGRASFV